MDSLTDRKHSRPDSDVRRYALGVGRSPERDGASTSNNIHSHGGVTRQRRDTVVSGPHSQLILEKVKQLSSLVGAGIVSKESIVLVGWTHSGYVSVCE